MQSVQKIHHLTQINKNGNIVKAKEEFMNIENIHKKERCFKYLLNFL